MIEYVKMAKKHLDEIAELEKDCFNIPWSKNSFAKELKNDIATYIVAVDGERVVGYGGFWQVINEAHITNIAVSADYRRQGIGTEILNKLTEEAEKKEMIGLTLEVRQRNQAAKNLYMKMGFKLEGVRKEYYSDTKEDALIMWKYIIDENLVEKGY